MTKSSGKIIKVMALLLALVVGIGSLIGAALLNEKLEGLGSLVLLIGIVSAVIIGILLYAFGELVENSALMVDYMKTMTKQRDNSK